jgi:hypothetical protein
MNASVSLRRALTLVLIRCVDQVLPASRADWAKAMRAELDHLQDDEDALAWAMGCLVAASKERIVTMLTGNLKISRWILLPEMLLCFVPLTIGWLDAIGGNSGIVRLNGDVIQKHFLQVPGGTVILAALIAGAILGVLGPLGLTAAFRLVVSGHPPRNRWLRTALVAGPVAYGVLTLVIRVALGGADALGFDAADSFDFWSGVLLLSALPALGAVHMLRLAPQSPPKSLAAA